LALGKLEIVEAGFLVAKALVAVAPGRKKEGRGKCFQILIVRFLQAL
jgi:hypothetical protein